MASTAWSYIVQLIQQIFKIVLNGEKIENLWPNRTKNVEVMSIPNEHKQKQKAEKTTWNLKKALRFKLSTKTRIFWGGPKFTVCILPRMWHRLGRRLSQKVIKVCLYHELIDLNIKLFVFESC